MGEFEVNRIAQGEDYREFMGHLLADLTTLERMISGGELEKGVRRIGAEQEFFLIGPDWRPAMVGPQVLEALGNGWFTSELGRFNIEANLPPLVLEGGCLSKLESSLLEAYGQLRETARDFGAEPALVGILPTLQQSDLTLENMTPEPRYFALNEALKRLRSDDYHIRIKGTDELTLHNRTVMLEACNTSFQIHFQVAPEEFAHLYNVAQLVTGPMVAVSAFSPLLFGRNLWSETRIALFQQAVDTRPQDLSHREVRPRVGFGTRWVEQTVLEIFREDIARFRALLSLAPDQGGDAQDGPPKLRALCLHNGTVYRWNRPCYGILNGKPHLRIEHRALPSGPSIVDEVANAALFFGLMAAYSRKIEDVRRLISFEEVKANFFAAARFGLRAQFHWIDGRTVPAGVLVRDTLVPLAREGLQIKGIDEADIDRYLGVIKERVQTEQTGARWLRRSFATMRGQGKGGQKLAALTAGLVSRQKEGLPVARWPLADCSEAGEWKPNYMRVDQYMTTDLYTVHEDETVDFVANLMDWQKIRHVPVEDRENRLVGIVSYRTLVRFVARRRTEQLGTDSPVSSIMKRDPVAVEPETPTLEAIEIMKKHKIGCLPVVKDGRLVGIITERDFMLLAAQLVEQKLRE